MTEPIPQATNIKLIRDVGHEAGGGGRRRPGMWERLTNFLYFHCQRLWPLGARYRCPLFWSKSARTCYESGECGCDNAKRFTPPVD